MPGSQSPEDKDYLITCKKRVIQFVQKWVIAVRHGVFENPIAVEFIEELASEVDADPTLQEEAGLMHHVLRQLSRYQVIYTHLFNLCAIILLQDIK